MSNPVDLPVATETTSSSVQLDAAAALPAASTQEPVVAATSPAPAPEFEAHTAVPSLLDVSKEIEQASIDATADAAKPVEAADAAKPAEPPADLAKPAVDAAPKVEAPAVQTIAYKDFTLPEGVVPVGNQMDTFKEIASKHGLSQEAAQAIIDLHINSIKQYDQAASNMTLQQQHKAFSDTRKAWREQVLADEQLGGAGHQTTMGAVARARDRLLCGPGEKTPSQKSLQEFNNFLASTGAGDHPALLRMLHNASRLLDEPRMPPVGAKPPPQQPQQRGMRGLYNK